MAINRQDILLASVIEDVSHTAQISAERKAC